MGVDFGVIWAANFGNVRQPAQQQRVAVNQNSKEMTIFIVFGVIRVADFNNVIRFYVHRPARQIRVTRRQPKLKKDGRYIAMGIDFGVIWVSDFNNVIRFYVRRPARRPSVTHCPP